MENMAAKICGVLASVLMVSCATPVGAAEPGAQVLVDLDENYRNAEGIWRDASSEVDRSTAMMHFRKGAQLGHAPSLNALGIGYRLSSGVPKDSAKAYALFSFASELGFAPAKANLDQLVTKLPPAERLAGEKILEEMVRQWRATKRVNVP